MSITTLPPKVRILFISTLIATVTAMTGCAPYQTRSSAQITEGYEGGETVAVLLPKSGRYAGAAEAIRDGILASQGADRQAKRPQLRFYDSSDAASVPGILRQAAAEGARLAIGPLQKEAVNALAASSSLPIPTLALNRISTDARPPANLYQFALAPEEEAAEAANGAWAEGYRNAVILYPDGRWGDRVSLGFRQQWVSLGGQVVAGGVYHPGSRNFSRSISSLFDLAGGASNADFLFLVATASNARLIAPQIQRIAGSGLPIYATSHVYSESFDPTTDAGLLGIYFVDIPWLLAPKQDDPLSRARLRSSISGIKGKYTRLYAMGIDAYGLAPRLTWMASHSGASLDGKTGRLTLDAQRRVRRELTLARIERVGAVSMAAAQSPGLSAPLPDMRKAPMLADTGNRDVAAARR